MILPGSRALTFGGSVPPPPRRMIDQAMTHAPNRLLAIVISALVGGLTAITGAPAPVVAASSTTTSVVDEFGSGRWIVNGGSASLGAAATSTSGGDALHVAYNLTGGSLMGERRQGPKVLDQSMDRRSGLGPKAEDPRLPLQLLQHVPQRPVSATGACHDGGQVLAAEPIRLAGRDAIDVHG